MPADRAARLMFQLPRDCRVYTVLQPAVQWGWNEILTNKMVYLLETLVWQNTKDAQKKQPKQRPKMFTPEFMEAANTDLASDTELHTTDDIRDILAKNRV